MRDGRPEVDVVLTTREFARLLKREGIQLADLEPSTFDNQWMGDYSGAAVIFGTTGGVMEAAIRTVNKVVTGEELSQVEFTAVQGLENIREAQVDLGHGVGNSTWTIWKNPWDINPIACCTPPTWIANGW